MFRNSTLFLTIVLFMASGCKIEDSADVNQDKIWAHYELIYDVSDTTTIALAEFRLKGEEGDIIRLNEAASIRFNDQELQYNEFYSSHILELNALVDSGSFIYTDLDQFTFTNSVNGIDSIDFPEGLDTIFKSQSNTIQWQGIPLQANETASLFLDEWTPVTIPNIIQSTTNSSSLELMKSDLVDVVSDSISLSLMRESKTSANQSTSVGGIVSRKYLVTNRVVQVVN